MPSPFDTGIRLTVTDAPDRVACTVDEFVRCPTNARADATERALNLPAGCTNNSPGSYSGHWREWHRGHGCEKDPSKTDNATTKDVTP